MWSKWTWSLFMESTVTKSPLATESNVNWHRPNILWLPDVNCTWVQSYTVVFLSGLPKYSYMSLSMVLVWLTLSEMSRFFFVFWWLLSGSLCTTVESLINFPHSTLLLTWYTRPVLECQNLAEDLFNEKQPLQKF